MPTPLVSRPARLAGASLLRLQSDERLALLAREGHDAAFAALVQRHRPALVRYCAGIVGAGRAEDAVQQACINAHAALARTEPQHVRAWLYRIAHNVSLNILRSIRDEVPLEADGTAVEGPEEALERRDRLRATLDALQRLPERQRAALVLRELEGRSHEEIAGALGVSTGAARQQLMRARTAMRQAVTALTPYSLIAQLAAAAGSGPASAPLGEAAASAGAAATVAKLAAGIAATGALVGGVVAPAVHHHARDPVAPAQAAPRARDAAAPGGAAAGAPDAAAGRSATRDGEHGRGRQPDTPAGARGRRHGGPPAERRRAGEDRAGGDGDRRGDGDQRGDGDRRGGGEDRGGGSPGSGSGDGDRSGGDDRSGTGGTTSGGSHDGGGTSGDGGGTSGGSGTSDGGSGTSDGGSTTSDGGSTSGGSGTSGGGDDAITTTTLAPSSTSTAPTTTVAPTSGDGGHSADG